MGTEGELNTQIYKHTNTCVNFTSEVFFFKFTIICEPTLIMSSVILSLYHLVLQKISGGKKK